MVEKNNKVGILETKESIIAPIIYDCIRTITNDVFFGTRAFTQSNGDVANFGFIIYRNGETHSFDYVVSSSLNDARTTGYYTWNEEYVFLCNKDGEVKNVFDINNKVKVTDINEKDEICKTHKM